MNSKIRFVLTCEHADFQVPRALKKKTGFSEELLKSHRGWDLGAYRAAEAMKAYLRKHHPVAIFAFPLTRLLIDANRTLKNGKALSKTARGFSTEEKKLLTGAYAAYRRKIEKYVAEKKRQGKVIVLSIHSFTPVMNGRKRATDLGLLFRKKVEKEHRFAQSVRKALHEKVDWTVHFNRPYRGHTDCFLNDLGDRHLRDENVVGLFIEFNQKHLATEKSLKKSARRFAEAASAASRDF